MHYNAPVLNEHSACVTSPARWRARNSDHGPRIMAFVGPCPIGNPASQDCRRRGEYARCEVSPLRSTSPAELSRDGGTFSAAIQVWGNSKVGAVSELTRNSGASPDHQKDNL